MIDVTGSSDALGPSPIAVEGPARDGPWFLHGARVNAEGNQRRGLEFVTSGGRVMMTGCVGERNMKSANRVRKLREAKKLSKAGLARLAGISPITVDRIEKGMPSRIATRRKILLGLGLTPSQSHKVFRD